MVIYRTTNLINGKKYIGRDVKNNRSYLGSGVLLKKAIKKYGKENFKKEILEYCITLDDLILREEYWLKKYNVTKSEKYYNILDSSTGGDTLSNHPDLVEIKKRISIGTSIGQMGHTVSDETKRKISESNKLAKRNPMSNETKLKIGKKSKEYYKKNDHPMLGKTKETNKSLKSASEKKKGQIPWNKGKLGIYSDETRKKMSESANGRIVSEKTKQKLSESAKGRIVSEETRRKISESNKGKYVSEETRKKMSESAKYRLMNSNKGKTTSIEISKK